MWIRSAFWEGAIKTGEEARFRRTLTEEMVPELKHLPGVRDAKILWPRMFEGRPSSIICQILVEFDDERAMRRMLASPERQLLHARLPELKAMIVGTLAHVNYEVA